MTPTKLIKVRTGGSSIALLPASSGGYTGPWQPHGDGTETLCDPQGNRVILPCCVGPTGSSNWDGRQVPHSIKQHYHTAEELKAKGAIVLSLNQNPRPGAMGQPDEYNDIPTTM